jgi:DNA primase
MPSKYAAYYAAVADRILPFLAGRPVAIEQRFPSTDRTVYRRHTGAAGDDTWIRVGDRDKLLEWVRKYAEGIHANIRSTDRGAWFVIDIDSRELPTEMAKIAAIHAADVLAEQHLEPLVKFSGSDGYHLMWDVPALNGIDDTELWEMERAVVRAVACEVERRLADDPAAESIRETVGEGNPAITTSSADRENPNALLFDEYILKENANFRVPYSIHPTTGLAAAPIPRDRLPRFDPGDAAPERVAEQWPNVSLPRHSLADVRAALDAWRADGCA